MLSPNTIFHKTELGNAEIASRKLGLRAELRRLLILVDGRKTAGTLATFVRLPEVDGLLYELQALGVIEDADGAAPAPAASAPAQAVSAPSGEPTASPTQDQFVAARRAAVRFLNDTLGPDAESLAIKLERTTNAIELRDVVTQVRQSLERMMGANTAQRFLDTVRAAANKP